MKALDIEKWLEEWPYDNIAGKLDDCFHNGDTVQEAFQLIVDSPELAIMTLAAIFEVSPKDAQKMYLSNTD